MKILRTALFALGLLVVASAAQAQTTRVAGEVPFRFVVDGQVLPAGHYTVTSLEQTEKAVVIRNLGSSDTRIALTHTGVKRDPAEKTVLVFHRIGDEYFLAEIWAAGQSTGRVFRKSPLEIQMTRQYNKDDVIVAAVLNR